MGKCWDLGKMTIYKKKMGKNKCRKETNGGKKYGKCSRRNLGQKKFGADKIWGKKNVNNTGTLADEIAGKENKNNKLKKSKQNANFTGIGQIINN